jgi:hypothetical protein
MPENCCGLLEQMSALSRASGNHELHVASVAWHFVDFAIDNIDLVREFVTSMTGSQGRPRLEIVLVSSGTQRGMVRSGMLRLPKAPA